MTVLGKGRAEAIAARDIAALADQLGCHPADLEAIAEVESNGFGWFPDGRMKILFEKHWFYKNLPDAPTRALAVRGGLARKDWVSPKKGGYKDQGTPDARYSLLARAIAIDEEAALRSISMGRFQIMGFNYGLCGFLSAKHMWTRFLDSEKNQLDGFAKFLKGKGLVKALQTRNFARIEEVYNGGGLGGDYADRMVEAADKLRAGKWKGYVRGSATSPVAVPPTPAAPAPTPTAPEAGLTKSGEFYPGTVIASDPSILVTPTGYDMFHTDLNGGNGRTVIAKASSTDGRTWKATGAGVVAGLVMAGRNGQWDENVESASIVKLANEWRLYFSGYRDIGTIARGFPAALWAARSTDGRTFTRISSNPVMAPTKGWYDNDAIYSPTILREGGVYHMVYVGHAYTDVSKISGGGVFLLSATSTDGITWVKGKTPIAAPGQFDGWRADGIAEPYLIKAGSGSYLLFFTGLAGEERAIGVATASSPTGPWTFGSNAILTKGAPGAADEHQVLAPAAVIKDGRLILWYLAANTQEVLSIGRAEGDLQDVLSLALGSAAVALKTTAQTDPKSSPQSGEPGWLAIIFSAIAAYFKGQL